MNHIRSRVPDEQEDSYKLSAYSIVLPKKNKITAEIEEISGSVEIAPGIGLADAVCDIVSSGSTLLTNGSGSRDLIEEPGGDYMAIKTWTEESRNYSISFYSE